jgi:hypothetical protein
MKHLAKYLFQAILNMNICNSDIQNHVTHQLDQGWLHLLGHLFDASINLYNIYVAHKILNTCTCITSNNGKFKSLISPFIGFENNIC